MLTVLKYLKIMVLNRGRITLHDAVKSGDEDLLNYMIRNGYDADERNETGFNCLHLAVFKGDFKMADSISRNGALVKSIVRGGTSRQYKPYDGCSVLHFSVANGDAKMTRLLFFRGAPVNVINHNLGFSPLHIAVLTGNSDIVKLLLECGADANLFWPAKTVDMPMSLHTGFEQGEYRLTPLHLAAVANNLDIVDLLLKYNADVTLMNSCGDTPLHSACKIDCDLGVLERLLCSNAFINIVNMHGETPLLVACKKQISNVVRFLVKSKCDVNWKDDVGTSALHLAVNDFLITEILLEAGADISVVDARGETPLFVALRQNNLVEKLLKVSSCYNSFRNNDNLSVHLAATLDNSELCECLLLAGVDPNIVNNNNQTAFHIACEHGNRDIMSLLLDNGFDINLVDPAKLLHFFYGEVGFLNERGQVVESFNADVIDVVLTHLIKVKATGQYLSNGHLNLLAKETYYGHEQMLDRCKKELELMKKLKIGNMNLSCYDLFLKHEIQLVISLHNKDVTKFAKKSFAAVLPIFGRMVDYKLYKALLRKSLSDKCKKCCESCDEFSRLPYNCIEHIINLLAIRDLRTFIGAIQN